MHPFTYIHKHTDTEIYTHTYGLYNTRLLKHIHAAYTIIHTWWRAYSAGSCVAGKWKAQQWYGYVSQASLMYYRTAVGPYNNEVFMSYLANNCATFQIFMVLIHHSQSFPKCASQIPGDPRKVPRGSVETQL